MVEFNFLAVSLPHVDWWKELQLEVLKNSFYDQLSTGKPIELNHRLVKRDGVCEGTQPEFHFLNSGDPLGTPMDSKKKTFHFV